MKTRAQALHEVAQMVAEQGAILDTHTPMEAAQRAWHPGGPSIVSIADEFARERCRRPECDRPHCGAATGAGDIAYPR